MSKVADVWDGVANFVTQIGRYKFKAKADVGELQLPVNFRSFYLDLVYVYQNCFKSKLKKC